MQFNDLGKAKHENSFSKGHAGVEFFFRALQFPSSFQLQYTVFSLCSMLYTCNVNSSNLNFVFVSHHCMWHNNILHVLDACLTVQAFSGRE